MQISNAVSHAPIHLTVTTCTVCSVRRSVLGGIFWLRTYSIPIFEAPRWWHFVMRLVYFQVRLRALFQDVQWSEQSPAPHPANSRRSSCSSMSGMRKDIRYIERIEAASTYSQYGETFYLRSVQKIIHTGTKIALISTFRIRLPVQSIWETFEQNINK